METIIQNIKQAQWFELVGESLCAIGSILYIIDSATNSNILIYQVPIFYLIGSILFLLGSFLMIIQSIYTICKINVDKKNYDIDDLSSKEV